MPANLVELEAEIRTKKIFSKSQQKNTELETEINELEFKFKEEKEKWDQNVLALKQVSEIKHQLERSKFELEHAERTQDYESASKLKYSIIPELEQKLKELEKSNAYLSGKLAYYEQDGAIKLYYSLQRKANEMAELLNRINLLDIEEKKDIIEYTLDLYRKCS